MAVDLHLHTLASDGTLSPKKLVQLALKSGLKAISITDHDTIEAVRPAIEYTGGKGIEIIPGVELGGIYRGRDVHILGYFIDIDDKKLNKFLLIHREHRLQRARLMAEKLNAGGFDVTYEEVIKISGEGSTGRLHIAKLLVAKGYSPTINDAFKTLIGKNSNFYVQKKISRVSTLLNIIHGAGGLAVLAHPKMLNDDGIVRELAASGIDGIEVYHYDHFPSDVTRYKRIAKEYGLAATGGSDFHGLTRKKGHAASLAKIPNSCLDQLITRRK